MRLSIWFLALSAVATPMQFTNCGGDDDDDTTTYTWYYTCGDPVCSGYTPPAGDIPLCTDQQEGDPCYVEGDMCDPQSDCNALMVCAAEDPKADGCPISRKAYKHDIEYLDASAKARYHDALMEMKLATYHYNGEPDTAPPRLGFIIDDNENSPAVLPSKERVDLYGYTSMTVAAVQVQARQIADLQREVEAMKKELETTRETLARCQAKE